MKLVGKKVLICGSGISGSALYKRVIALAGIPEYYSDRAYKKGEYNFAVISPGISKASSEYIRIRSSGIPIYSEADFGYFFCPARLRISVSGTNGKTTVVRLTEGMLQASGLNAVAMGNIGVPFCALPSSEIAVCELSSFMLEQNRFFKTHYSAITNIAPDHLEWHGGYGNYKKAKYKLYSDTTIGIVAERDFEGERNIPVDRKLMKYTVEEKGEECAFFVDSGRIMLKEKGIVYTVCELSRIQLNGIHNLKNILCALSLCTISCGYSEKYRDFIFEYQGEPYRQQKFYKKGKTIINDSKATNCAAVIAALNSVSGSVALLLGGSDKGEDYSILLQAIPKNTQIYISGENKEQIRDVADKMGVDYCLCDSLEQAADMALASTCETILFSPASASFDRFQSFEERGLFFERYISQK